MDAESAFVEERRRHLLARLESKARILREGGLPAQLHSPKDLVRISFALKRIDEGQYGLCTNCGCLIEEGRLRAIPETPFCVECEAEIEGKRTRQTTHNN